MLEHTVVSGEESQLCHSKQHVHVRENDSLEVMQQVAYIVVSTLLHNTKVL